MIPANVDAALRKSATGVYIELEVTPGASDDRFPAGFNSWRKRITARVRAHAQDGAANGAVVELVASFFDVPSTRVEIASGHKDRQKTVHITGVSDVQARERLANPG